MSITISNILNFLDTCISKLVPPFYKSFVILTITLGIKLLSGFDIAASYKNLVFSFSGQPDIFSQVIGTILILSGIVVGIIVIISYKNKSIMFYLAGLKNSSTVAPIQATKMADRLFCVDAVFKARDITYNKSEMIEEFRTIKNIIENRVHNSTPKIIYVCGSASIPAQFLFGTYFRNGYEDCGIEILDYKRGNKGKWQALKKYSSKKAYNIVDSDQQTDLEHEVQRLINSPSREVGIALSYTFEINRTTPQRILGNDIMYLKCSLGRGHDILESKQNQEQLCLEISEIIGNLANHKSKIHLFIAAQSSFVINLGMHYMDGSHGALAIHNYNVDQKLHDWALEFNGGNVS